MLACRRSGGDQSCCLRMWSQSTCSSGHSLSGEQRQSGEHTASSLPRARQQSGGFHGPSALYIGQWVSHSLHLDVSADPAVLSRRFGPSLCRLGLPSEDQFWSNGISACAICDGALVAESRHLLRLRMCIWKPLAWLALCSFLVPTMPGASPGFKNQELAVVGGGDTALEEALYLTKYGKHVHLLVRSERMRASKTMQVCQCVDAHIPNRLCGCTICTAGI